jgi:hypothetical protein
MPVNTNDFLQTKENQGKTTTIFSKTMMILAK